MLPKLVPLENQSGSSVVDAIPERVTGVFALEPEHREIWERAKPHLRVRDNDAHTLYAYGIARVLCEAVPGADPAVVLPAILLHDTGWSRVPEESVLEAIRPGGGRPDLVLLHEREGVRIAEGILGDLGYRREIIDAVAAIILTHDSVREARSIDDAVVKDADKVWRVSPHGIDTVMDWFGLEREAANRLCSWRVHEHLHTDAARLMARGLAAIASVDCLPERVELG
ncbi:MAG: HD domain-containing protein [Candidatus Leucobacter sulfamidivorax]|nr:HD domain-containing protein [Candidatus Leucobacter sulfamidivorax]